MNTLTINKSIYPVLSLPKRPKALLDRTVAKIYNVETRIINQAVSNNPEKFPKDFCFRLSKDEFQMIKKIRNQIGESIVQMLLPGRVAICSQQY